MNFRWRLTHSGRLIDALKEKLGEDFSARFIKRSLESNVCRVNGKIERFASTNLQKGDWIELIANWNVQGQRSSIPTILFEDDELLVVNKSAGDICIDNYFQKVLHRQVFLAHRLDKETTGVLLFGKSYSIAKNLQRAFEEREVEKEYLALVDRSVGGNSGTIESRFVKKGSYEGQTIWGSSGTMGLYAKTEWKKLETQADASLLLCRPYTGRTHQIRVHLSEMGHPILIDRQYAKVFHSKIFAARPLLHALCLRLSWKGRLHTFQAKLSADFADTLVKYGFSVHE